jgi:CO/xanthine dehydrogenase Mo-binding subunit
VRLLNGFKSGSVTASGQILQHHDVNLLKVLDTAVERTGFVPAWKKNQIENVNVPEMLGKAVASEQNSFIVDQKELIAPGDTLRKGIGLALSYRGCSLGAEGVDAAAAFLSMQNDGSVYLLCGLAENGQGLRTTFSIVAAEVLGINPDKIYYLEQDTGIVPDSGPTVASRSTLMGGGAVKNAAETVRARLETALREEWKLADGDKLDFANDVVTCTAAKKEISFGDLCMLGYKKGISLATVGWYKGPNVHWDEETGQGDAYFTYVYGCHAAEITVNIATGVIYLNRVVAVHDPGTVINLQGALGQIYGGVTQGAGYGMTEEISSHNGFIRELNFDQYILLTAKDIDVIEPIFIEGRDEFGAWGGKSLGEPTLELTAAAIANAVRNATGERFYHLPINLEEVLLRKKLYPEELKRGSM